MNFRAAPRCGFARKLDDRGYDPVAIMAESRVRVAGSRKLARILYPSPGMLVSVRRCFQERRTVMAMIDRAVPERRTVAVQVANRTLLVSQALMQLGLLHEVRIVFMATRLDRQRGLVTSLGVPAATSVTCPEVVKDFASFLDRWLGTAAESFRDVALHRHEPGTKLGVELAAGGESELR